MPINTHVPGNVAQVTAIGDWLQGVTDDFHESATYSRSGSTVAEMHWTGDAGQAYVAIAANMANAQWDNYNHLKEATEAVKAYGVKLDLLIRKFAEYRNEAVGAGLEVNGYTIETPDPVPPYRSGAERGGGGSTEDTPDTEEEDMARIGTYNAIFRAVDGEKQEFMRWIQADFAQAASAISGATGTSDIVFKQLTGAAPGWQGKAALEKAKNLNSTADAIEASADQPANRMHPDDREAWDDARRAAQADVNQARGTGRVVKGIGQALTGPLLPAADLMLGDADSTSLVATTVGMIPVVGGVASLAAGPLYDHAVPDQVRARADDAIDDAVDYLQPGRWGGKARQPID
ncbi:hypothetical protein ACPYO6_01405 [Georgenia sp. Z1344]|uniref:hypothetical protein n=1 Tax=Georgenia sp. Z1344 TaxID=3416706 RepID=UPI003CEA717E